MNNLNSSNQINISTRTIFKIVIIVLALFFLYNIIEILGIVFVAWVLASALDPLVDKLHKYKIPRFISILFIYCIMILLIVLIFTLFIPAFTSELTDLSKNFPKYYQALASFFESFKSTSAAYGLSGGAEKVISSLTDTLSNVTDKLYNAATGFVGGVVAFFAILVITFYMIVQEEGIKNFIQSIVPDNYQPYIIQKMNRIQQKLGSWLWGQIILMIIIGLLTALALQLIGVKYVLLLALIAGLCEFIPIVGPIISAVPAVLFSLIGAEEHPYKPGLVLVAYIIIQQLENHVIVPKIMSKAVGLNPIVVIITMLIGAKIGGIVGILLAVPAATILSIFLEDFFTAKKDEANKLEGEDYINKTINKEVT